MHPPHLGPLRCALYVRVSSRDKGQTTENQLPTLRKFARDNGYEIVKEYEDKESAAGEKTRPAFNRMLADAQAGHFDVLVFWSLDRFTREGAYPTLEYLNNLSTWGVGVRSYMEQYLDTVGIFRDAIIAILGVIAQQESRRISERVKAGVDRVRAAKGGHWGRRPSVPDIEEFTRDAERLSVDELVARYRVSRSTVYTLLRRVRPRAA